MMLFAAPGNAPLAAAPSFNGRTVGSEPINRGSNPWGATNTNSVIELVPSSSYR